MEQKELEAIALREYRDRIDALIRKQEDSIVLNSSAEHAAAIIERMCANAEATMRILTRRLSPIIFCAPRVLNQMDKFAARSHTSIQILVEDMEDERAVSHDVVQLAHERDNFEVRRVTPELSRLFNANFALMDDRGYRFEKDKTQPVAIANFNDRDRVETLAGVFSSLWSICEDNTLVPAH